MQGIKYFNMMSIQQ